MALIRPPRAAGPMLRALRPPSVEGSIFTASSAKAGRATSAVSRTKCFSEGKGFLLDGRSPSRQSSRGHKKERSVGPWPNASPRSQEWLANDQFFFGSAAGGSAFFTSGMAKVPASRGRVRLVLAEVVVLPHPS